MRKFSVNALHFESLTYVKILIFYSPLFLDTLQFIFSYSCLYFWHILIWPLRKSFWFRRLDSISCFPNLNSHNLVFFFFFFYCIEALRHEFPRDRNDYEISKPHNLAEMVFILILNCYLRRLYLLKISIPMNYTLATCIHVQSSVCLLVK